MTSVDDLLAAMDTEIRRVRIPSTYGDAEIFALEVGRVFGRRWIFVAYESEVPARPIPTRETFRPFCPVRKNHVSRLQVDGSFVISRSAVQIRSSAQRTP